MALGTRLPVPFISIHIYVELILNWWIKWPWRCPRQIKGENTVIYSFSLFLRCMITSALFSVSECLAVCLLCSVFESFWVSSFDVYGECVSHLSMSQRAGPGPIYYVSWPKGPRLSLCVSCSVFLCVSVCLLLMCMASVSLPSLWVRGLDQGQFTKSVGPRGRGCSFISFLAICWFEIKLPMSWEVTAY